MEANQLPITSEQIISLPCFTYGSESHSGYMRSITGNDGGTFTRSCMWVVAQGQTKTLCRAEAGQRACEMWDIY